MPKRTRKEKKKIIYYIQEQMEYLEDSFVPSIAPSIQKSAVHIKEKFDLEDIEFRFRIVWKAKLIFKGK